jgi:hypothetical protein
MPVRADEVVELSRLADPEYTKRQEAHQIREESRRKRNQGVPQIVLIVNGLRRRQSQVQYQQRHRHRENAVAQGGKAF